MRGSSVQSTVACVALQERKLGEIVKAKHGTDFWALEHFPMEVTPQP